MTPNIKGYENYHIAEDGKVFNLNTGKELKLQVRSGYLSVQLCKNSLYKLHLLHRLLAIAYIDNPEEKPQVNHKDGDKLNNSLDNLEWATVSENALHKARVLKKGIGNLAPNRKLDEEEARSIKYFMRKGHHHKDIAEMFKVSSTTVYNIWSGKAWSHL